MYLNQPPYLLTTLFFCQAAPQNGSHLAVLDLLHLLQQSAELGAAPAAAPAVRDPPTEDVMTKSWGNLETLLSEPVIKVDV